MSATPASCSLSANEGDGVAGISYGSSSESQLNCGILIDKETKTVSGSSGLRACRRRRIYTKSVEDRERAVVRISHVVYVRERSEHAAACVLAGCFFFFS